MPVVEIARLFPTQGVAVACELDRRGHHLLELQSPPLLLGIRHASDRAWNSDGFVTNFAGALDYVALRILIHVAGRRGWSRLAVVQEMRFAVGHADQHETAPADVSGRRMHYRERESGGNCRIDSVSTCLHDLYSGA